MTRDRIEFGLGLALQGGIGGLSREEPSAEKKSERVLTLGGTPAAPHVWIRDAGSLLNRTLSGIDLKIALSPEIHARRAFTDDVDHRLRLDVAIGQDNFDAFGFYGAYDNPLAGDQAWAVGAQTCYLDPLMWMGIFTFQPWLFHFGEVTPAYVEYRRTTDGRDRSLTAGLRTQLDWDMIRGSGRQGTIEN